MFDDLVAAGYTLLGLALVQRLFFLMEDLAKTARSAAEARERNARTAESCTGGWAAQVVTSVAARRPGSSGIRTYSNAAKAGAPRRAGGDLARARRVSEETAREMARGALERSRATVSVSITGVAGPAGGTPEKPVGTVCFAWARAGEVRSETRRFAGTARASAGQSVILALEGVMRVLDGAPDGG
jgi:nicotinamide-nucleotide amidase